MATDGRVQATTEVLNHVAHVHETLNGFLGRTVSVPGQSEHLHRHETFAWAAWRSTRCSGCPSARDRL
jgi:hypothetical protein